MSDLEKWNPIDPEVTQWSREAGVDPRPGETEAELRARFKAIITGPRCTTSYIDVMVSSIIGVERPAGVSTVYVKHDLAEMWLRREKPKKFFERLGWWMNLIWRLL